MHNRREDTGCCSRLFLKSIMIVFNTFFWLSGVAFLLVGLGSFFLRHDYISLLSSELFPITTYMFIGIGGVIFLMGILGCVGALKEIRCCLNMFTFMLMAVLVAEVCVGVIAYLYENSIHEELSRHFNKTITTKYYTDDEVTDAVDELQQTFECCGALSYKDWQYSQWQILKPVSNLNVVPQTCCVSPNATCAEGIVGSNIYQKGCMDELESYVRLHLIIIGGIGLGLSILQVFGIFFSCCLALRIKQYRDL